MGSFADLMIMIYCAHPVMPIQIVIIIIAVAYIIIIICCTFFFPLC